MKKFKEFRKERPEIDEGVDIKKALNKVKGLTKKQLQVLNTLPTPVLTTLINQLSMVVAHKESVEEAALVMGDMDILNSILNKIKDDIHKEKLKKKFEKSWPKMQTLAKMAGYGISKKMQAKGKTYRWELKKWKHLKH
mgnify:CR=1 FL=1